MTIDGALNDLNNLLKADDIPIYYKPSIKAVMETITIEIKPMPKRGKWERDQFTNQPTCSVCGYKVFGMQTNYCPACGSKNGGAECPEKKQLRN